MNIIRRVCLIDDCGVWHGIRISFVRISLSLSPSVFLSLFLDFFFIFQITNIQWAIKNKNETRQSNENETKKLKYYYIHVYIYIYFFSVVYKPVAFCPIIYSQRKNKI